MPLVPCRGSRPRRTAPVLVVALVVVANVVVAAVTPAATPAAAATAPLAPEPRYRPPVDAPVSDPFRPPRTPYGPGNRGLEYDTGPGTVVRAAADGRVTFAGLVAGSRHVTVLHDDGLRTTASYLATVDVVVGQRVHQGDPLGTTVGRLHFSARNGAAYLDPATLFGDGPPHVRLVPFDDPPGAGDHGERSAIRQLLGLFGRATAGAVGAAQDVGTATQDGLVWLQASSPELLTAAAHYATRTVPVLLPIQLTISQLQAVRAAWDVARRSCTPRSRRAPRAGAGRVAVLVAGFGSTSGRTGVDHVDVARLGYRPGDVVRFSYAGGRVPRAGTGDALRAIPARRYTREQADGDLRTSARRLADLVEQVVAVAPDRPVDLLAHSQGGVVARLALLELEARHGRAWLGHVGLLATMGSPHGGADGATLARALRDTTAGRVVLAGVEHGTGVDTDALSLQQMSELSEVVQRLDDHPVPPELRAVSIGARGDLIVPLPRTRLEGAPEVVVPLDGPRAHDHLPGDARTTRELALALAGAPPTCTGLAAALLDQEVGTAVAQVEDTVAAAAWATAVATDAAAP